MAEVTGPPRLDTTDGPPPLLYYAWMASNLSGRVLEPALRAQGITPSEYAVYSLLAEESPVTPSGLAAGTGLAATSVSYVVRRLEERGHLVRSQHPADARSYLLTLTEAGRRVFDDADAAGRRVRARVDAHLGRPVTEVSAVLRDLCAALSAAISESARPVGSAGD